MAWSPPHPLGCYDGRVDHAAIIGSRGADPREANAKD